MEWQPIETIPKDGTDVLICFGGVYKPQSIHIGCFSISKYGEETIYVSTYYWAGAARGATHWQPLPEAPK